MVDAVTNHPISGLTVLNLATGESHITAATAVNFSTPAGTTPQLIVLPGTGTDTVTLGAWTGGVGGLSAATGTVDLVGHVAFFGSAFDDTAGTSLLADTPGIGTSWTSLTGTTNDLISPRYELRKGNAGANDGFYFSTANGSSNDMHIASTARVLTATGAMRWLLRNDGTANNYVVVDYAPSTGRWNVNSSIGGVNTSLLTNFVADIGLGDTNILLDLVGTLLTCSANGVELWSLNTVTDTTGLKAGCQPRTPNVTDTTGIHLMSFLAYN